MEIRKLIKSGQSSMVISLPQAWISRNKLKKGDNVCMDFIENNVIISPFGIPEKSSAFEINNKAEDMPYLEVLLYAAFLSDKKEIIIKNVNDDQFYKILKMIKKFHYLSVEEKKGDSLKLKFVVDVESIDIEKELNKILFFIDLFFKSILDQQKGIDKNIQDIYYQISSQITLCMKIIKLKFLKYEENTILRIKQELDAYYFLLKQCKELWVYSKSNKFNKVVISQINKIYSDLEYIKKNSNKEKMIEIMKFLIKNQNKEDILNLIKSEKSKDNLTIYLLIYNIKITLDYIAYAYVNNL